jgi:hypothetical protein
VIDGIHDFIQGSEQMSDVQALLNECVRGKKIFDIKNCYTVLITHMKTSAL